MMKPIPAETVKAARVRLKETQAEFAKRFGVNQSTVHRWETEGIVNRGTARAAFNGLLSETSEQAAQ